MADEIDRDSFPLSDIASTPSKCKRVRQAYVERSNARVTSPPVYDADELRYDATMSPTLLSEIESRLADLGDHQAQPQAASPMGDMIRSPLAHETSESSVPDYESMFDLLMPIVMPESIWIERKKPNNDTTKTLCTSTDLPTDVKESLVDTFFKYCHNQPYSYFQETFFRQRFTKEHPYFQRSGREIRQLYASEAWHLVMQKSMDTESSLGIHEVQTLGLLAIHDFTSGRTSQGWLKIGLATRICQDLHFMKEPHDMLCPSAKDEQRRTFWSIYLIDKLISCGRDRRPVILDEDCHVGLPSNEMPKLRSTDQTLGTLRSYLCWDAGHETEALPNFSLTIQAASILGRCARIALHDRDVDRCPPWDPTSDFTAVNSLLFLLEYRLFGEEELANDASEACNGDGMDEYLNLTEHDVFARTVFHLCHCLLNHPFLLRMRLKGSPLNLSPTTTTFLTRAFRRGLDHACSLIATLEQASQAGNHVSTSFYAYCACLAGSIIIIHLDTLAQTDLDRAHDLDTACQQCFAYLRYLEPRWDHACKISGRLRHFKDYAPGLGALLNISQTQDLQPGCEDLLWTMVDYGLMCQDFMLDTPGLSMACSASPASEEPFDNPHNDPLVEPDTPSMVLDDSVLDDIRGDFLSAVDDPDIAFLLTAAFSGG
ncbi:hypothetical protein FSARC_8278 [Fusarium sarcochroum]|uniref:Xylanolytic transcriptional activator regulatory domain-containing protein n=1 Tax=Fusarium sarcochroum TaxID=1208366 RepID=A0A8H4TTI9_9HYPO|nr:hypothetical protein FSARC_8278 [Fusarium sarcochroum]